MFLHFALLVCPCLRWQICHLLKFQWGKANLKGGAMHSLKTIAPSKLEAKYVTFPNLQQPRGMSSLIRTISPTLGDICDLSFFVFQWVCVLSRKLRKYSLRQTFQNEVKSFCPFFHICCCCCCFVVLRPR